MNKEELVLNAKKYCINYHKNQKRKTNEPYSTHPIAVAKILKKYGYDDSITQAIAYLHDVVEDGEAITKEIESRFGFEIANGVFILSRNTISKDTQRFRNLALNRNEEIDLEEMYRLRLSFARRSIKRVKIADMIHNTKDLENLKPYAQKRKINDSKNFYIPLGKKVCLEMVKELEKNIEKFEKSKK